MPSNQHIEQMPVSAQMELECALLKVAHAIEDALIGKVTFDQLRVAQRLVYDMQREARDGSLVLREVQGATR